MIENEQQLRDRVAGTSTWQDPVTSVADRAMLLIEVDLLRTKLDDAVNATVPENLAYYLRVWRSGYSNNYRQKCIDNIRRAVRQVDGVQCIIRMAEAASVPPPEADEATELPEGVLRALAMWHKYWDGDVPSIVIDGPENDEPGGGVWPTKIRFAALTLLEHLASNDHRILATEDYGSAGISWGEMDSGELELKVHVGPHTGSVFLSREMWEAFRDKAGWDLEEESRLNMHGPFGYYCKSCDGYFYGETPVLSCPSCNLGAAT